MHSLDDDDIARALQRADASGELRSARSWGKPLAEIEGWAQTPPALRLGFKILKDADVMPAEIELFHRRAALARRLAQEPDAARRQALQQQLSELQQLIALRLEALRRYAERP